MYHLKPSPTLLLHRLRALAVVALLAGAAAGAQAQSHGGGRVQFGQNESIHCITPVKLKLNRQPDELCLAYKTTTRFFVISAGFTDDGYVIGKVGDGKSYFPMPGGADVRTYQQIGLLPNPLPAYDIPTYRYVFGNLLWLLAALLAVLALLWLLARHLLVRYAGTDVAREHFTSVWRNYMIRAGRARELQLPVEFHSIINSGARQFGIAAGWAAIGVFLALLFGQWDWFLLMPAALLAVAGWQAQRGLRLWRQRSKLRVDAQGFVLFVPGQTPVYVRWEDSEGYAPATRDGQACVTWRQTAALPEVAPGAPPGTPAPLMMLRTSAFRPTAHDIAVLMNALQVIEKARVAVQRAMAKGA